jgi:hypothetical protein
MQTISRFIRSASLATLVALPFIPSTAAAQSTSPGAFGFISTRYSNSTSDFLFAGYGHGDIFGLVGLIHNPRTDYNEVLGGLGMRFSLASWNSNNIAVAYSEASDSPYLQLYVLPSVTVGRTTADLTLQVYAPGSSAGVWQVGVNPVSVTTRVIGPLSLGGSYQMAASEHALSRHMA